MDFHIFPRSLSNQLILKRINKGMRTDFQLIILPFSAFKSLFIDKAFKINHSSIAIFYRTVNGNRSCVAVSLTFHFRIYFLIGHNGIDFGHGNTFIFSQRHFRFYSHFRSKNKRFAFLQLNHINLGLRNNIQSAFIVRFRIGFLKQDVSRIFVKNFHSVHLLNHNSRNLAFTESRDTDTLLLLIIRSIQCFLQSLGLYLDGEFRHIFFQIFNLYTHYYDFLLNICKSMYFLCRNH